MIRFKFKNASSNGEPASAKAKEANHDHREHDSYVFRICRLFLGGLANIRTALPPPPAPFVPQKGPAFTRLSPEDVVRMAGQHPVPCVLSLSLLFFMAVEYTLAMVPASSAPVDVGFVLTRPLHGVLVGRPNLSSALAALNTVFVGMQIVYIVWTFLVEGRPRPTIAALFMFTCRGILGCSTRLPLPEGFLGSGVDFPVGNVSFFLFFSGHVGGSVIASQDMRRARRRGLARTFDVLNVLQVVRLLATRGHYTIDLAAGLGAGFLFDALAGNYEEWKEHRAGPAGKL
ncbi:phosphatidylcholine:diacylglycerol cholinephosphotransferase 1-like [Iris pallida]|uniref:Phosphatidylcholine:diacylglycerol cholinephosphotransferase 1-like n=1 Tax=Iris pallida TaxID=29817 RepID=A0AAX6GVZ8_IRIPA|nr:phosphatidylcholine:diacylglycerol cholinephosphotransferase 1-like [Iris pallida]